jgi:hypothetical protein
LLSFVVVAATLGRRPSFHHLHHEDQQRS